MIQIFTPLRRVGATAEVRRRIDTLRMAILTVALLIGLVYPAASAWAQSQEAINATVAVQVQILSTRLDKIENLMWGVLLSLSGLIASAALNIRRAPDGRR